MADLFNWTTSLGANLMTINICSYFLNDYVGAFIHTLSYLF